MTITDARGFPPYPGDCQKCGDVRERDVSLSPEHVFKFRWVCLNCEVDWGEERRFEREVLG
jgi:hypothetical protein